MPPGRLAGEIEIGGQDATSTATGSRPVAGPPSAHAGTWNAASVRAATRVRRARLLMARLHGARGERAEPWAGRVRVRERTSVAGRSRHVGRAAGECLPRGGVAWSRHLGTHAIEFPPRGARRGRPRLAVLNLV